MDTLQTAPLKLSVLVVDDDPDTAESMADILTLNGHAARWAASANSAITQAAADPPDVVVPDIRMPGMDGYELAVRLASAAPPPLLVAISGCGSEEERQRSKEAGIHLQFLKPLKPAVLIGVMQRLAEFVATQGATPTTPLFARDLDLCHLQDSRTNCVGEVVPFPTPCQDATDLEFLRDGDSHTPGVGGKNGELPVTKRAR